MKYLWLFFLVQGCWYYTYYQYFSYQNLAPWQRPARGDVSNQIAPSACDQSTNLEYFSSNNCQTSCCMCSDLFVTCLHFCLAPWYLCTCKSFFWYMLACLSTSLKSRHVHVHRPVHADHHDCKVLTNAGTEVEIPTLGRRALPPHLKKKIHFSPHIFILNCSSGWKYALDVCSMCSEIGTFANVGCARQRSRGVARRKMVTIIFISISIDHV